MMVSDQSLAQDSTSLVIFVHVPKTAGSTINHHLAQSGIPGASHIEGWVDDSEQTRSRVEGLGWVSGHLSLPRMQRLVASVAHRPSRLFTLLREPVAQVTSHYNWLIEIFHRGESFYDGHPPQIKEISERIRNSDNSSPSGIIDNLLRNAGLFLNQQSRTVIGGNAVGLSRAAMEKRLEAYEHIAVEGGLSELVQSMTGQAPSAIEQKNRSPYHFDPGIFRSPALREFLASENAQDQVLYDLVAGRRNPA